MNFEKADWQEEKLSILIEYYTSQNILFYCIRIFLEGMNLLALLSIMRFKFEKNIEVHVFKLLLQLH